MEVQKYLVKIFGKSIPVIDPSIAALKAAEHLAMFKWNFSDIHSMQKPSESDLKKYDVFQTPYELAHIITV